MSSPRIAVIGAGPAGLALAVLLHKHGIPLTIFDLRERPTNEELSKPSGMLDLHEESGIATLSEAGLSKQFLKLTGDCAEAQKIADKDGNILYIDQGEMANRPEVSRHALTKLLISNLPAETFKWDHKLLSATSHTVSGRTEIELDFGPDRKQIFDLVIGADGAWSRIRNLLSDVKPQYAGIQNFTFTIRHLTTNYPQLAELLGIGSFSALGLKHGVMSHRGPQDSARIYVLISREDEKFPSTSGLDGQTPIGVKDKLLTDESLFGLWGPKMKELIAVACDEESADNPGVKVDLKPLYSLPVGHSWEHKPGATMIGDAAHLMCPWAGEGVNLAMWDSRLLADAIVKAYKSSKNNPSNFQNLLDPLIRDFEVEMVSRAQEKAEETVSNGQMLFGEDGANAFVAFFHSFMPPQE